MRYNFCSYWPFNDAKFIYRRSDISGLWCINSVKRFSNSTSLHLTSGGTHVVSVVVFEKANLENCKETIEGLIHNRYNDTNVTKNTERLIDALNNK